MKSYPFLYNILPEENFIVVRFRGEFTRENVIEASRTICSDERYAHGFDGLIELAAVTNALKPEDLQKLVEYSLSKQKHGHGKWALIVNTPAATAFAMMYQNAIATKHPFAIFCSFEGASEFLQRSIDSDWLEQNLAQWPTTPAEQQFSA